MKMLRDNYFKYQLTIFIMNKRTLMIISAILFLIGIVTVVVYPNYILMIVVGMFLVSISILSALFSVHFPETRRVTQVRRVGRKIRKRPRRR